MKKPILTLTLLSSMGLLAACGPDNDVPENVERPPATTSGAGATTSDEPTTTGGGTGTTTSAAPGTAAGESVIGTDPE